MTKTLKFAAAAVALIGASAAYASQDDARPDNAWIAKDVASIHMEPQVIVTAAEIGYVPNSPYSPYSLTLAPAPRPRRRPIARVRRCNRPTPAYSSNKPR